ncbi:Rad17-domain-containing protein [Amylocystis lapponica]|nr:Rad17-domain-containing protein [Amylocystis lapponica]
MSQKPSRSQKRPKPSSSKPVSTLRLESVGPPPAKKQKVKPLTSIARPPIIDLTESQPSHLSQDRTKKGKEKAREPQNVPDDRMWIDMYEPTTEEDLAVHKRKVQDVRQWLLEAFEGGPSSKLKKYRRILALTGPAGTAKTATIRVLARELGFEILEWRNTMDERFSPSDGSDEQVEYEGLADKFRTFMARASSCHTIFSAPASEIVQSHPSSQASRSSQSSKTSSQTVGQDSTRLPPQRQIILLEDLPNILHPSTQASFHAALETFAAPSDAGVSPLVIIVSDAGLRGENAEDDVGAWRPRTKEVVDIRSVLPPALLSSPYVTQIGFRPIAPTLLRRALQHLVSAHFSSARAGAAMAPSKGVLDLIVESANGDIRSAVMALQFACVVEGSAGARKKGKGGPAARVVVEAVARREQSLALFHLLGKLLYNKRKGDPPGASASKKDIQRDKELDARIKNPPALPSHLEEHERRASRVDVETLYADTPIDGSLLSLYIHQNYTQYCSALDEAAALSDALSAADASGGESWMQANPHYFHVLARGTLHALPSPVVRRGQRAYKPAFFDVRRAEREAVDGVHDVQAWLRRNEEWGTGGWSMRDVALELGAVLRVREGTGGSAGAPPTHRLFSRLEFGRAASGLEQLAEDEDAHEDEAPPEDETPRFGRGTEEQEEAGGWLEEDEIEDF